jgi:hypothetical protein
MLFEHDVIETSEGTGLLFCGDFCRAFSLVHGTPVLKTTVWLAGFQSIHPAFQRLVGVGGFQTGKLMIDGTTTTVQYQRFGRCSECVRLIWSAGAAQDRAGVI